MPDSESSSSHMPPLAALPPTAGRSLGEIVNVMGDLYVLTEAPRTNVFRGLTGRSADSYVGAIRVAGSSDLGSFAGPAKVGEVTWRRLANGQTSVRLRIPRAAVSGARLESCTCGLRTMKATGPSRRRWVVIWVAGASPMPCMRGTRMTSQEP